MKINCISCGHNIEIDDIVYDTYDGQIKCFACNALLKIKTNEGRLVSINFIKILPKPSADAKTSAMSFGQKPMTRKPQSKVVIPTA